MPFPGFELACVVIVALALVALARTQPWRPLLTSYAGLALAGWLGEETCIAWYRFYAYAPSWHGRVDHVPVLVPVIWPLVILSARAVVDAVAPSIGRGHALAVAALVVVDASLVEVIAVRAGLWAWAEPGHLGVPVIGILGWGFFTGGADLALRRPGWQRPLALLGAVAATHALIVATWWACFKWTLRGDLGDGALTAVVLVGALAVPGAWVLRRQSGGLPLPIALPRMIAASLFVVTLIVVAADATRLWLHTAAVAAPYLALTAWRLPRGVTDRR